MSTIPSDPHLASFPRPKDDNGKGLHFVLDASQGNIDGYGPYLQKFGIKWTTVYNGSQEVVVRVAKQLYDKYGIVSVLRYDARQEYPHNPSDFAFVAQLAIKAGIPPYVQVYNEPEIEWGDPIYSKPPPGQKRRIVKSAPQNFADYWGSRAQAVVDAGGFPGLQILSPDYLNPVLSGASDAIKQKMFFCLHNYGANHPPNYPYNIGKTVMEDDTAVLRFLEYAKWFKDAWGFVPPMIGGEGGWLFQNHDDTTYPAIGMPNWGTWNMEMFHWFKTGVLSNGEPLPDYLFSVTPWLLYASNWYSDSWVDGMNAELKKPFLDTLADDPLYVRQFGGSPPPPPPECPPGQHWDVGSQSCVNDPPPPPPPSTTGSKNGLHISNVGTLLGQSDLYAAKWTSFVVLHINKGFVPDLRSHFPNATIVMRAYLQNWYTQDPVVWSTEIAGYAKELQPYTVDWTFANEQNLAGEGHPMGAPHNGSPYFPASVYQDINNWNLAVIGKLRELVPFVRIHWPALSQGHSDDQDDGTGYVGFEICRPSIEACDVLDVHTYFNVGNPAGGVDSEWYGKRYAKVHALFPGKPIYISEYGGTFPDTPGAAAEYKHWLDSLPDYVSGAAAFIWDSDAANARWRIYNQRPMVDMFKAYTVIPPPPPPIVIVLTDTQIAKLVVDAKFAFPEIAFSIILAESGGKPAATNTAGNTPPSTDRGLWQINWYWHSEVSDAVAFDPVLSTKAAFTISNGGTNYSPWSAYKAGTYKQFLPRAQAAISAITPPSDLYIRSTHHMAHRQSGNELPRHRDSLLRQQAAR